MDDKAEWPRELSKFHMMHFLHSFPEAWLDSQFSQAWWGERT